MRRGQIVLHRITIFVCGFALLVLASCGGGGGGDGGAPKSLGEAVALQAKAGGKLQALIEELIAEENAANTALDEERYEDFDAYWQEQYPDWVDRLSAAVEEFLQAEDGIQKFLPAGRKAANGDEAKFVPLGVVLVAAVTITTIAVKERERLARLNDPVPDDEKQDLVDARARYLREQQGLTEAQAQTRAIADVGAVQTLQGLRNGIEHARQFAVENLVTFFGSYLPESIESVISLADDAGKVDQIRQNTTVLLSDTNCGAAQNKQLADAKLEEFPTCRVSFCDPGDLQCGGVPEGRWATTVLSADFVRDEPTITVANGQPGTVVVSLSTPDEVQATPTPEPTATPTLTPEPTATPTAGATPTAAPTATPSATPTSGPTPTPAPTAEPVTNFAGFWAGASCPTGPARYEVSLSQSGAQVTGTISFHNCPGGGRVAYSVSGTATSAQTVTLSGPRTFAQGDPGGLPDTTPQQGTFTVARNMPPDPNYAP